MKRPPEMAARADEGFPEPLMMSFYRQSRPRASENDTQSCPPARRHTSMDGKYYTRLVELVLPKRARTICTEWQIMQICAIYRVLSLDSEQHSSDELPSCSPCKRCQRKQPMPNPLSPNQAQGMLSSQQS